MITIPTPPAKPSEALAYFERARQRVEEVQRSLSEVPAPVLVSVKRN